MIEWIPVSNPPPKNESVIALADGMIWGAFFGGDQWWIYHAIMGTDGKMIAKLSLNINPTHWINLNDYRAFFRENMTPKGYLQ